jgi:internalin A
MNNQRNLGETMTTPQWALDKIKEAKEKNSIVLHLSSPLFGKGERLSELPGEILELQNLTTLNLHGNQLSSLPESLTQLQNLTTLHLSGNQLSSLPESLTQLQNLTQLNLDGNQLSSLPESVTQLQNLTFLGLSQNQLSSLPESVTQLQHLTSLGLIGNQLSSLPESLTQLQHLTSLGLSGNQLSSLPESVTQLQNLTFLGLSGNQLSSLPESLTQLQNLTTLNLRDNQLSSLPESLTQLQNLTELNLDGNQLSSLPESLTQLQNLTTLNLRDNQLSSLPESLTQLQNLTELNLDGNQLSSLPESLTQLQNLTTLNLRDNQLSSLPESVTQLQNLTELNLDGNQLSSLPESLTQLQKLEEIYLEGNKLESPPQELAEQGIEAIRNYFRQLNEQGQEKLYEAKLLVLGEGGAGKTTFANKIKNPEYQLKEEKSTEGVDVIQWVFPLEDGQEFKVNVWDFGGQEVYHATHQFFLTKRSLYVLVADNRKEDTDFYYWLNTAELLSESSPLLIVNNEKQERKKEIDERHLKGQFNNIKDVLDVNLATNSGLDKVRNEVEHHLKSLPHIGSPLPRTWVDVRKALEGDQRNYISLEEYLSLCKQNGFADSKDGLQLSGYLNDIGVCLHFQDEPLLKKTVILKPKWGTDAVYQVLDDKNVIRNKGRFSRVDIDSIWDEPQYENMRDELLLLMMKFKLCYEIPNQKGTYIAPQLLSENQPEYAWDGNENLFLQYKYEFMPKGILLQFIVAMSDAIWDQTVWKSGVVLENGGARAEVTEYYRKRQIHVRVSGSNKKALMTIVIHELDKIHKAYKQLKYDKMIPCNCEKCKASETPHFYKLESLLKRLAANRQAVECEISYNEVSVRGLIDDIIAPEDVHDKNDEEGEERSVHHHYYADYINKGDKIMTEIKQTINNSTIHGSVVAAESIKDSFNTIEKADIKDDLKEQLKQLNQAVEAMTKELPKEKAEEVADYMKVVAEQGTKEKPNPALLSVSIDGLIKAAQNLGKVGDAVIDVTGKVRKILTGGIL